MNYSFTWPFLTQGQKKTLRSYKNKIKQRYVKIFYSYDKAELLEALAKLGLGQNDTVMMHSAYSPYNGFQGSPDQIIAAVKETIGPGGTLLMPSSTYNGSTEAFVKRAETFDVKRSPSSMGILSEIFRLQSGTLRSHNPIHPVLASGPKADWYTEGHDLCAHSCGDGSPFEKLAETNAKALFFNVPLRFMMFFHYLEHTIQNDLPFDLYDPATYQVPIIDAADREGHVAVHVFSREARKRRRFPVFLSRLAQEGKVQECKIGNSKLALVNLKDTLEVAKAMVGNNTYFHDVSGYPQS